MSSGRMVNGEPGHLTPAQLLADGRPDQSHPPVRGARAVTKAWYPIKRSESRMISIVGTWRLVRAEAFAANGTPQPAPLGGAPVGRLMFTSSGRMMAMTGDGRGQVLAGQVREYTTYAGNYTFD